MSGGFVRQSNTHVELTGPIRLGQRASSPALKGNGRSSPALQGQRAFKARPEGQRAVKARPEEQRAFKARPEGQRAFKARLARATSAQGLPSKGNKRSRPAPKGQRAHSPGQRPGYVNHREVRPEGAKALADKHCVETLLPFQGALLRFTPTQGVALGFALVAPSGRTLNARQPMAINLPKVQP